MHKNKLLQLCDIHKRCRLLFGHAPCIIIAEIGKRSQKHYRKKERDEIMMKGFFNDLVAARMLDLDQNRVKSMSRKARHNAK